MMHVCYSTKKLWKVTIFWLGMDSEFWFEKTRLHLIANLHYFVLFLFPIHLLILLSNSCIVMSRVSFIVSNLGTPYVKRCSLRLCFLIQNYFLSHCIIKWWSRGGARYVDPPVRLYRYVFRTISWNIEIHSEILLSYKSFVTSSDV